jgi:hypothetical protein
MSEGEPRYWLNLFTGSTWDAFRNEGASTCGFPRRWRKIAGTIVPGGFFICYLTGVMRWVGVLKVTRGVYEGKGPSWTTQFFPLLFDVESEILLDAVHGVPLSELEGMVDFFMKTEDRKGYKQFFRHCPNEFRRRDDALLITKLIREAKKYPVERPVSQRLLNRVPAFKKGQYRSGT